jgi:hypothetical protein
MKLKRGWLLEIAEEDIRTLLEAHPSMQMMMYTFVEWHEGEATVSLPRPRAPGFA